MYWQTRSHAERGESLQNQDFVGGIQNRRRFAPTIFLVPNPFLKNCGIHCTKFELFLKAIPNELHPATICLGQRRRGDGLARAEEGSGEESARASAFTFGEMRAGYIEKRVES